MGGGGAGVLVGGGGAGVLVGGGGGGGGTGVSVGSGVGVSVGGKGVGVSVGGRGVAVGVSMGETISGITGLAGPELAGAVGTRVCSRAITRLGVLVGVGVT